jgi:hypothetical protein
MRASFHAHRLTFFTGPPFEGLNAHAEAHSVACQGEKPRPHPRAELLHILMHPDFERADRIGEFWGYPESRAFAELLIDCEENRVLRAVLVGMLRERQQ